MHRVFALLWIGIGLFATPSAWGQWGQSFPFASSVEDYRDLSFSKEPKVLGFFSVLGNNVFRPSEGQGPFPAVVLVHTCGGLEPHIKDRAKELVAAGFLVLVLDSLGPRGLRQCDESDKARRAHIALIAKDSYDALGHLAQLKEVDSDRVYLVGFSWGGFAASLVASPEIARQIGSEKRFRASAGWYGSCAYTNQRGLYRQFLRTDADRPVLLLLGGKDTETTTPECLSLVEKMKADGKPVTWHVYEEASHAWDKSNPQRGYVYSAATTSDAMQKTVDFLRGN